MLLLEGPPLTAEEEGGGVDGAPIPDILSVDITGVAREGAPPWWLTGVPTTYDSSPASSELMEPAPSLTRTSWCKSCNLALAGRLPRGWRRPPLPGVHPPLLALEEPALRDAFGEEAGVPVVTCGMLHGLRDGEPTGLEAGESLDEARTAAMRDGLP